MRLRPLVALLAASLAVPMSAQAARFTYHGQLLDGDAPAQGAYDLRVRSFAQPGDTKALGEATELPGVMLRDGSFSVELEVPEDDDGTTWIEVAVRPAGAGDYEPLGAPQPLAKADSACPGAWAVDGNTGLPAGSFLGIADTASATPLQLKARNELVALFTPRGTATAFGSAPSVTLGSSANGAFNVGATVGGGGSTVDETGATCGGCANIAQSDFATVAGGAGNIALGKYASISGGRSHFASGTAAGIAGGESNYIAASWAAIGGGQSNRIQGAWSNVGGGQGNQIVSFAQFSVIGGGLTNHVGASNATIAGGGRNIAYERGSVPGGYDNLAGIDGFSAGRSARSRLPGAPPATLPPNHTAADYAGAASTTGDQGTFMWSDASNQTIFRSSAANQFLVRASGGVGINTARFGQAVDLRLSELVIRNPPADPNVDLTLLNTTDRGYGLAVTPGAAGAPGEFFISETDARAPNVIFAQKLRIDAAGTTFVQGGAVGNLSDARLKKNVAPIDNALDTLLGLQGRRFEYIDPAASMNPPGLRMGFVAQQVQGVIPEWVKPTGSKGYLAVTPVGFEALAVEAIRDLRDEQDERVAQLEASLAKALARIEALEAQSMR